MVKDKIKLLFGNIILSIQYFGWFSLVVIPTLLLITLGFFRTVSIQKARIEDLELRTASQETKMIDFHISKTITSTGSDLSVIRDSNETQNYLSTGSNEDLLQFRELIYRVSTNKVEFIHVAFVDLLGNEVFKVSRDNDGLYYRESGELKNISNQVFFNDMIHLTENKLYFSEIEVLNNQNIMKFVSPVFLNDINLGMIVIDYDADFFLSVFEQYFDGASENISYGLISGESLWFINEVEDRFNLIIDNDKKTEIMKKLTDDAYSFVNKIELAKMTDYLSSDSKELKIYSIVNIDKAISDSNFIMLKNQWIIIAIDVFIIFFFLYMLIIIRSKNYNKILLNVNIFLADRNQDAVIITDNERRITYVNKAFEDLYRVKLDEIKKLNPKDVIGILGVKINESNAFDTFRFDGNIWNVRNDGIILLRSLKIKSEASSYGKMKHYMGIYSMPKITLDEYLDYNKNKEDSIDILFEAFSNFLYIKNQTCIMLIRVYQAKAIDLAEYIHQHLSDDYTVIIPKDGILMIHINTNRDHLINIIDNIEQSLESYRHLTHVNQSFSSHFVISMADDTTESIKDLLKSLFVALEVSKNSRNLKHLVYEPEMKLIVEKKIAILNALENAFELDEFYLEYQIQKDIINQTYIGAESLLRWKSSTLGQVSPFDFIPVIENSFFINQLTIMVIKKVIADFTPFIDDLPENFKISINLTNFDFSNHYIMDQILQIIDDSIINSRYFCFEITESNYLDDIDKTNRVIALLHKRNISVGLDDFGTGFSSISSLKLIKVDEVKIDRSFIKNYPETDNGKMFSIIAKLIHNLDKMIVVEGTETEAQIKFAIENKCHFAQGYYIAKPMAIEKMMNQFFKK